jgi:serine/threonine protein kinase
MEFVDGESLAQVIPRIGTAGMLDWQYAFRVALHIARALEAAAEHEIIHCNITPANILVRSSDKVTKLGDLMLAKRPTDWCEPKSVSAMATVLLLPSSMSRKPRAET